MPPKKNPDTKKKKDEPVPSQPQTTVSIPKPVSNAKFKFLGMYKTFYW